MNTNNVSVRCVGLWIALLYSLLCSSQVAARLHSTNVSLDCLSIRTSDLFGDGWSDSDGNAALLYLFKPNDQVVTYAADCSAATTTHQLCPNEDGHYIFTLSGSDAQYWEVHFEVTIDRTGTVFTGGYNTTLALLYEHDASWSLVYANNMKNATQECEACLARDDDGDLTSSGHPKPKPKPKPLPVNATAPKPPPPPPPKPSSDNDDENDDAVSTTLTVTMSDAGGDGWFKNTGFGAAYFISSADRSMLLATGTLCSGVSHDTCEISLRDGSYIFRAAAAMDEDAGEISWDFCDVAGGADLELYFYIQDGVCYPQLLLHRSLMCASSVSTTVTMTGVMILENVDSLQLPESDLQVLSLAFNDVLPAAFVNITSVIPLLQMNDAPLHRLLSTFVPTTSNVGVEFELTLVAEDFGFDGRRHDHLVAFLSLIDSILSMAYSSGGFDASIHSHHAVLAPPSSSILNLVSISLHHLDITHIFYDNILVSSIRIHGNEASSSSSSSFGSSLLIAGAVLFAVVFATAFAVFRRFRTSTSVTKTDADADALRI